MIKLKGGPDDDREYWYRYQDRYPNSIRLAGKYVHGFNADLVRCEYPVVRKTPKGVVLNLGGGQHRFVLEGTRKQFAHPDDTDALVSFMYRKRAQRRILRSQVDQVESALIVGQELLSKKS